MLKLFQKKHSEKGFTLIELLVVISIIGILSSIVLVSMGGARSKARDAKRQSDIRQIGTALELHSTDNDYEYYQNITLIVVPPTALTPYMATVPSDPTSSVGVYGWVDNSGTGNSDKYCIYATLEETCATAGDNAYYTSSHLGVEKLACQGDVPDDLTTCK